MQANEFTDCRARKFKNRANWRGLLVEAQVHDEL